MHRDSCCKSRPKLKPFSHVESTEREENLLVARKNVEILRKGQRASQGKRTLEINLPDSNHRAASNRNRRPSTHRYRHRFVIKPDSVSRKIGVTDHFPDRQAPDHHRNSPPPEIRESDSGAKPGHRRASDSSRQFHDKRQRQGP